MNKLKNIGISALAGTLVSLSAAQAGGVSVTGSYELSYTNLGHQSVSGNKLGVNKNISFGAGGDMSDGGGVTWSTLVAVNDGFSGLSSASMSINMGGIATLTYDSGTGGTGANAVDNIVPTAWEEVDYGLDTGISDLGAVSASKGVITLGIKAPTAGTGLSLSYAARMGDGHTSDGATSGGVGSSIKGLDMTLDFVNYDAAHFGVRWGIAAQTELHDRTCQRENNSLEDTGDHNSCNDGVKHNPYGGSMFSKLQLGPLHLGTQATFKNHATTKATAIMNTRSIVGGMALVFGDTLSVSYGVGYDKYRYNDRNRGLPAQAVANAAIANEGRQGDDTNDQGDGREIRGGDKYEYQTQKYRGYSVALNLGPVALKGTRNIVKGDSEHSIYGANGDTHSEINLSIAF